MGKIKGAFIMPHPPIIVPFIGRKETEKAEATINAMREAAKLIAYAKPDTIITISPHGNVFDDYVFMMNERVLTGNFHKFGDYSYEEKFTNDVDLLGEVVNICKTNDFPAGILNAELRAQLNITDLLDHGALVPLYFISREYTAFKILHISVSNLDKRNLFRFGEYVREAVGISDKDVVVVASGDLSHYLSDESPYGYRKEGPDFDNRFVDLLKNNEFGKIFDLPGNLTEKAGQCGLKSFEILAGILGSDTQNIRVLSYEGPFGIGYAVADLMGSMHRSPYAELAYDAIAYYLKTKKHLDDFSKVPDEMINKKAGTFVSLKKNGNLRGCIGTLEPYRENVALEIVENAISAAFRDPRFDPLAKDELDKLDISVDILSEPEKIESGSMLDPKRYGVIVSKGFRRGVLLPDLEGVDDVKQQISIALSKASIRENEKYDMERFEVTRYK
jgi:MEMO1 family protein